MSLGCRKGSLTFCISAVSGAFLVSRCSSFAEIRLIGGNINKCAMSLLGLKCYTTNRANLPVTLAVILPNRSMIFCGLLNVSAHFAVTIIYTNCSLRIYPILAISCVLIAVSFEIINSSATGYGAVLPMLIGAILVVFAPLMGIGGLVDLAGLGSLADRAGACFNTVSLAGRSSGNLPCAPLVTGLRNYCSTLFISAGIFNTIDRNRAIALVAGGGSVLGAGGSLSYDFDTFMFNIAGKLSTASYAFDAVSALECVGIEALRKNMFLINFKTANLTFSRSKALSICIKIMTLGRNIFLVNDIAALGADILLFALFGAGCSSNNNGLIGVALSIVLCAANVAGSSAEELVGGLAAYIVISTVGVTNGSGNCFIATFTQALAGVAGRSSRINEVTESSNAFGSVDNLGSLGIAEHGLAGLAGPVFLQTGSNAGSRLLGSVYEVMSKLRNDNVIADGAGNSFGAGCLCVLVIDMGSSGTSLDGAANLAGAPVGGFVFICRVIVLSSSSGAGGSKNSSADRAVVMVNTRFAAGRSLYKQILDRQTKISRKSYFRVVNSEGVRPCCGSGKCYGISFKIV